MFPAPPTSWATSHASPCGVSNPGSLDRCALAWGRSLDWLNTPQAEPILSRDWCQRHVLAFPELKAKVPFIQYFLILASLRTQTPKFEDQRDVSGGILARQCYCTGRP